MNVTIQKTWIALILLLSIGFGMRLWGITKPLVDKQYWRQADTASIARNFHDEGMNILYPRVNWRGATPGYVESEFPLYSFLVAVLYKTFRTTNPILGRWVSLFFALGTIWIIYLFVRRLFDRGTAFYSALMYALSPMVVHYTRTFMPESMLLFLYMGSIYCFLLWIQEKKLKFGILAVLVTSLALLTKLTAVIIFVPMLGMLYDRERWAFLRRIEVWGFYSLCLIAPVLWYWHAYQLYLETQLSFGILTGVGFNKFLVPGLLVYPQFWSLMGFRFVVTLLTPLGAVFGFLALIVGWKQKEILRENRFLYVWVFSLLVYMVVLAEGVRVLEYYLLYTVPVAGIFIARGIIYFETQMNFNKALVTLYTVIGLCALLFYSEYFIHLEYPYVEKTKAFAHEIKEKSRFDELFVVMDFGAGEKMTWYKKMKKRISCPSMLFHINRKGWVVMPYEMEAMTPMDLEEFVYKGARYFLTPRHAVEGNDKIMSLILNRNMRLIHRNDDFILFHLIEKQQVVYEK
jgi:Dolichyl-phosphate-mannose-protein mannosyltransferase